MVKNLITELYEFHQERLSNDLRISKKHVGSKFFNNYIDYKSKELAYFTYMDMGLSKNEFYFHNNLSLSLNEYVDFREQIDDLNFIDELNLFHEMYPYFDFNHHFILNYGHDLNKIVVENDYFVDLKERYNLKESLKDESFYGCYQVLKFLNDITDMGQDFELLRIKNEDKQNRMMKWLSDLEDLKNEGFLDCNQYIDTMMNLLGIEDEQRDVLVAVLNDELSEEECFEKGFIELYDTLHNQNSYNNLMFYDQIIFQIKHHFNLESSITFLKLNEVESDSIKMAKEYICEKYPHLNDNGQQEMKMTGQIIFDEGLLFNEEIDNCEVIKIKQRFNNDDLMDNAVIDYKRLMLEDFSMPIIHGKSNPLSFNEMMLALKFYERKKFHFTEKYNINVLPSDENSPLKHYYGNNMGICVFDNNEMVYRLSVYFPNYSVLTYSNKHGDMKDSDKFYLMYKEIDKIYSNLRKKCGKDYNAAFEESLCNYASCIHVENEGHFNESILKTPNNVFCEIGYSSNVYEKSAGYSQYAYNLLSEFAYENNIVVLRNKDRMTSMGSRYLINKFHNAQEENPNLFILEYAECEDDFFPKEADFYHYRDKFIGDYYDEKSRLKTFRTEEEVNKVMDFWDKCNNMSLEEFKEFYIKEMITEDFLRFKINPQFNDTFVKSLKNLTQSRIEKEGYAKLTSQEYVFLKEYHERNLNRFHNEIKDILRSDINERHKEDFVLFITMSSLANTGFLEGIKHLAKEGKPQALNFYLENEDKYVSRMNDDTLLHELTNFNNNYSSYPFQAEFEIKHSDLFVSDEKFKQTVKDLYKQKTKTTLNFN